MKQENEFHFALKKCASTPIKKTDNNPLSSLANKPVKIGHKKSETTV